MLAQVLALQQQRTLGHQQPDRVLNRVNVCDQIVRDDEVEDVEHVSRGRPGSERHERGPGLDPVLAQQFDGQHRLRGGVALVQAGQDLVVDALQRADDE